MQLARPLPSCEYSPGPQTSIQRNNMIKSLHRVKVKVGPHTVLTIIYPSHILLLLMNAGNLPSLNVSIQSNSLSSLRLSIQTSVLAKTIRGGHTAQQLPHISNTIYHPLTASNRWVKTTLTIKRA